MSRRIVAGIVVIGALAGAWFFLLRGPGELTLVDPDCPLDAPVFAMNLYGDLRQDDVAVLDRDGHLTRLTKDHASFGPSFSPDGNQIVFTSGREGGHEECCGYIDQEIYVMNSDGSDQRRLMPGGDHFDGSPAWSPDGSEIAFWRRGQALMVVASGGGEPEVLHERDNDIASISWAPDGRKLVFNDRESIYIVDRETGEAEVLAEDLGSVGAVKWSPDGHTFAFNAGLGVHTATLEEPNPRRLIDDAQSPEWSPDGKWLAYYAIDEGDVHMRLAARPVSGGDPSFIEVDKKNIYSFAMDLDWLDCR